MLGVESQFITLLQNVVSCLPSAKWGASDGHFELGDVLLLVFVLLVVEIGKAIRRRGERDKHLLTYLIRMERRRWQEPEGPRGTWLDLKARLSQLAGLLPQLYMPSIGSVAVVTALVCLLWLVSHSHFIGIGQAVAEPDRLQFSQNLIAIQAGIFTIIFAMLIMVAESLKDDETKDRARVLLKVSFLFPLAVGAILSLLGYAWGDVGTLGWLPVLAVAAFTVVSLYRLVRVLLSRTEFARQRRELLQQHIVGSIEKAIDERLGRIVLDRYMKEQGIQLTPMMRMPNFWEGEDRRVIRAERSGVVTNIDLEALEELAARLEEEANINGFSFHENKPLPYADDGVGEGAGARRSSRVLAHAGSQYLHTEFREKVEEFGSALVTYDAQTVTDEDAQASLEQLARRAFVIGRGDDYSEEVRLELEGLRDSFLSAVRESRIGQVKAFIEDYLAWAGSFSETLKRLGLQYTHLDAQRERSMLGGGWSEVRWLRDSVDEVLQKACQTHDVEIIGRVAHLPFRIAASATKHSDQYLYQEFATYAARVYRFGARQEDQQLHELLKDLSWRLLKSLSDYYVELPFKQGPRDPAACSRYREYAVPILMGFQNLLKASFDTADVAAFGQFLDAYTGLYEADYARQEPTSEMLSIMRERVDDPVERRALDERMLVQREREKAEREVQSRKKQVLFGISAWALDSWVGEDDDKTKRTKGSMYDALVRALPGDLPAFTDVYISTKADDADEFWGWIFWETAPDGVAYEPAFPGKLDRFYCIRALNIVAALDEDEAKSVAVSPSRTLADLCREQSGTGELLRMLNSLTTGSEQWNLVLPPNGVSSVPVLIGILRKARQSQLDIDEQLRRDARLDPALVREFAASLVRSFDQHASLRELMREFAAYEAHLEQRPDSDGSGVRVRIVDEKAVFVRDWHTQYLMWGEHYGEQLADLESEALFQGMLAGAMNTWEVGKHWLVRAMMLAVRELMHRAPKKKVVVLTSVEHDIDSDWTLHLQQFTPAYRLDRPRTGLELIPLFMGLMRIDGRDVPLFRMTARKQGLRNKALVVDLEAFGRLRQYSPRSYGDGPDVHAGVFKLQVVDLNVSEAERATILGAAPKWLAEHDDREGYLRGRVLVDVLEKFEYKSITGDAGHAITIVKPDDKSPQRVSPKMLPRPSRHERTVLGNEQEHEC